MKNTNVRKFVGEKIFYIRKEQNLSQQSLADYSGITRAHICNIEKGLNGTTVDTLWKVCNALHVQPNDLFPETKPAKRTVETVTITTTTLLSTAGKVRKNRKA